jgi:hypothetical protein
MSRRSLSAMLLTLALASFPAPGRAEPIGEDWVAKWRGDLAIAADSLPRAHPNFFHSVPRETYRRELDSLATRLPRLAQHEIVVELARIVARVGEGHTRVTFPSTAARDSSPGTRRPRGPRSQAWCSATTRSGSGSSRTRSG